jgi:hypothetical protein
MTTRARTARPLRTLLAIALLLVVSGTSASACDPYGSDAAVVEQARQAVSASCGCDAAPSPGAYRDCVVAVLGSLRTAGTLTRSCYAHALRFETNSTCGRPGTVVCCRQGDSIESVGVSVLRPAGRCAPGREQPVAHRAEGCLVGARSRIVDPDRCGDGRLTEGEQCDPPDGTTCSAWCASCAPSADSGAIRTLACLDGGSAVGVAASQGTFLATYSAGFRTGKRAMAQRLGAAGEPLGAPLTVASAGTIARPPGLSSSDSVTSDADGFYVSWLASRGVEGAWRGRRLLPSGAPTNGVEELYAYGFGGPGMCGPINYRGPLVLATTLDESGAHSIIRISQRCGFSWLSGVPFQFQASREAPGIFKAGGGGRLARGTSDVASLWSVTEVPVPNAYAPPGIRSLLFAGWIEPGPQLAFPLLVGPFTSPDDVTPVPPVEAPRGTGLAAVGDVFLATYLASDGIRGIRFSRSSGIIDEAPGVLLIPGTQIQDLVATSDGARWVVAWREPRDGDRAVVRIVRVASDGSVVDEAPLEALDVQGLGTFGVAADATSIVVVYTERDGLQEATAVRMLRLPS